MAWFCMMRSNPGSSEYARVPSVATMPGMTELTAMPSSPSSLARVQLKPMTAPLAAT